MSPSLATFAFRSSEVRRLLLDFDSYGGTTDPLGMFPHFLKRTVEVMALRHRVVFRWFVRRGSFPAFWRQANVSTIPKGLSSSSIVLFVLYDLWNAVVCFQPPSLLIGKVWVPVMHFCVSHALQSALESGQKARIGLIDFSAAFARVNHKGILYKLCTEGIGGSVVSILTQFLSNRPQHFMMDGYRSKLVNVVSGEPHGSVLGPLFPSCTLQSIFPFWKIS